MTAPATETIRYRHEASGRAALGWWGITFLIVHQAALFIALLSAYLYIQAKAVQFPPNGIEPPQLLLPAIGTGLLVASSVAAYFAQTSIQQGSQGRGAFLLLGVIGLGAAFAAIQIFEYTRIPFLPQENAYTSLFFTITGIHLVYVLVGLGLLTFVALWTGFRYVDGQRIGYLQNVLLLWHFVVAAWLLIFGVLYLGMQLS
jgi:heme/copper-type cytochrome/quinol oxidase subunit 3